MKTGEMIVDVAHIEKLKTSTGDKKRIEDILKKSLELKGLSLEEAAILLNVEDEDIKTEIFKTAKQAKELIYGNRIVLFAPLYLSNYCVNNCLYCGFRTDNKEIKRYKLSVDEAVDEARAIMQMGHKRVLLVAGENTHQCNLDYIKEIIDKIYSEKVFNGEVRRLNLNVAPLEVEDYQRLSDFGIGTIQVFQETYHPEVYKQMHLSGPKANYDFRIEVMDRAIEGGINDFGMGALFGLCDYRFEVLSLLSHSDYLLNKYGVGPHTLSIPRIEQAQGSDVSAKPPHAISDDQFKKIVAVLRLSVPYTGMILTTRENARMRSEVLQLGVSQMSAGSKTNPGGYTAKNCSTEQFTKSDSRSLDEVVYELSKTGFMPSFCTSCYRLGRVGKDFMDLARPGAIKKYCEPNAISTFMEYLTDYASEETKIAGLERIRQQISSIENANTKTKLEELLTKISSGERDLYV